MLSCNAGKLLEPSMFHFQAGDWTEGEETPEAKLYTGERSHGLARAFPEEM